MAEGPDKGRAWLVVMAAMVLYMVVAGTFRAQGLLFVSFISTYNIDRKMASWPFSIRSSVRNLSAPLVCVLGQKYGISVITFIGGILASASCALCYFASDIMQFTVIWGCINGLGMALSNILPPIVIGQYFQKYRTTATGISYSGSCIGAFAFPFIIEALLMQYGLHGTYLILAGLFMHIIPAAMLFTKPRWCPASRNSLQEKSVGKNESKTNQSEDNGISIASRLTQNNHDAHSKVTFHLGDEPEQRQYLPSSKALNSLYNAHESTSGQGGNNFLSVPTISSLSMNNLLIKSSSDNFFDIDIDYLKQMDDLLFHMLSMDLPNMEISYRAILLEVDKDDLWHPEKPEIIQEIESMYVQVEKSLGIDVVSESVIKANGLYLKRTMISGALTVSKKSQSLRAVRKYFRTYKARALQIGKIRSAPNISNIYNELVRKDYILSKLRVLCNSNEIRIISHLSEYNPRDVLKVLFQLRCLYMLYQDLELNDQETGSELVESTTDMSRLCMDEALEKPADLPSTKSDNEAKTDNSLWHHIKNAARLFRNPLFLLICFTRASFFVTFNPFITTIVDFAMDRGLKETDGKLTIIAISAGDLIGRMGFGWITDRGFATLPRFMISVHILLGLCYISIPFMHVKWTLLPSLTLFGVLHGSLFIRHPLLVAKYLRENEQSIAVGCMELCSGVLGFLLPLYIGYFRDVTGSYNPIYYINGIIAILAGLSWLLESTFSKLTGLNKF